MESKWKRYHKSLEMICNEFISSKKRMKTRIQDNELSQLYEYGLILLFRLLFICTVEDKKILPINNKKYYEVFSLKKMRNLIAKKKEPAITRNINLWLRLKSLFNLIDLNSIDSNSSTIATNIKLKYYSGSLFSADKSPFALDTIKNPKLVEIINLISQDDHGLLIDYSKTDYLDLGTLYEFLMEFRIKLINNMNSSQQIKLIKSRGKRKKTGSFYTPRRLIKYMVDECVDALFKSYEKKYLKNHPINEDEFLKEINNVAILDPAMGTGSFLLYAAEKITDKIIDYNNKLAKKTEHSDSIGKKKGQYLKKYKMVVENSIYGVDLNWMAVEITFMLFWLKTASLNKPLLYSNTNLRYGNSIFGDVREQTINNKSNDLSVNKYHKNENLEDLMDKNRIGKLFHWTSQYPEIFKSEDGGFDIVLGNPPYISFGLGRVRKIPKHINRYIRSNYPNSAQYKLSWYAIFIERGVSLLRSGGYFSYLLPDNYLIGRYFSALRSFLLRNKILRIVLFRENFWKDVEIGRPSILFLKKQEPEGDTMMEYIIPQNITELINTPEIFTELQSIYDKSANRRKRIRLIESLRAKRIVRDIESKNSKQIMDYLEFHQGIRSKKGVGKQNITSSIKRNNSWKPALIKSNQICQYLTLPSTHYIHINPDLLYSGGWDQQKIEKYKLLIRRTGERIIASFDDKNLYHTNALIYSILTPSLLTRIKVDSEQHRNLLMLFCAILNSIIFQFYYQHISMKKDRVFPQVEIDMLEEMHIYEKIAPFSKIDTDLDKLLDLDDKALLNYLKKLKDIAVFNLIADITNEIMELRESLFKIKENLAIENYLSPNRALDPFKNVFKNEIQHGHVFSIDEKYDNNPSVKIKEIKIEENIFEKQEENLNSKSIPTSKSTSRAKSNKITVSINVLVEPDETICRRLNDIVLTKIRLYKFYNVKKPKRIFLREILPKILNLAIKERKNYIELKNPTKTISLTERIDKMRIVRIEETDDFSHLAEIQEDKYKKEKRLKVLKLLLDKTIGLRIYRLNIADTRYCMRKINPLIY
ncbi:MAG: N-6 DNA methylase [Candidatus Lokiarchaeota archaeon]|nr:N-6 DNA methylase [Candidatus Lokiarchaeota archaeon]